MRARVAYISSLGTTAILVAAALLMLAVVGAIVAFKGWPGAANGAGVQSVPLTTPLTRASATLFVTRPGRRANVVRTRAAALTRSAGRLSTAGLVKQVGPVSGVVKVTSGPGPSVHGTFPPPGRPIQAFPPPTGRNPVTVPIGPSTPGGGSGSPLPVQLPQPSGAGPAVTSQVGATVEQVAAEAPSPPAVVESVRSALPIH